MRVKKKKKNARCARRMAASSISGSTPAFLQFTQEPTEKPLKEDLTSPKELFIALDSHYKFLITNFTPQAEGEVEPCGAVSQKKMFLFKIS